MVQAVAVKVYPALTDIAVMDLHPVILRGIDIAENAEACVVHGFVLSAAVVLNSGDILAEGVNENIGVADDRLNLILPLLNIGCKLICIGTAVAEVRIAVRSYRPALLLNGLGDRLCLLDLFVILITRQLFLPIRMGMIAENALIAGDSGRTS